MHFCYLCGEQLTGLNKTVEHIIPNSIGGRLKSSKIICNKCNNFCGLTLDNELAELGLSFMSKLNIKKDRGAIQNFIASKEETGEKLIVEPGWITRDLEPKVTREGNEILITAGTKKRLKQELERLRKELEKDGYSFKDSVELKKEVINEPNRFIFNYSVNVDILLRAVSKIIASYYLHITNDVQSIRILGNFIRDGGQNNSTWFFNLFYNNRLYNGEKNHIIIVIGLKKEKILYGYFELFSYFGFICILNSNYDGEDVKLSYIFNPETREEKNYKVAFAISRADLIKIIQLKPKPYST